MKSIDQRILTFTKLASTCIAMLVVLAFSSVQSSAQGCSYAWGNIFVTSPATGSSFQTTQVMTIRWYGDRYTIGNYGGTYAIQYSTNAGVSWIQIATGINGYTLSYNWTIPAGATPSSSWRIRVYESPGPSFGCAFSNPGSTGNFTVIKACLPAAISQQPQSQTVCTGSSVSFSVTSDMAAGTYEWFRDTVLVATSRSNVYTISPVTLASAGPYSVRLRDDCNPVTATVLSNVARLTVNEPPAITTNLPATRTVCESANDTLRIRATGAGRRFQWFKDGVAIAGATDSNYVLINAGTTSGGAYTCVVTGTCAPPATSAPCALVVALKPRITQEPTNLDVCPGSNGNTLRVSATGQNLVYQWIKDGKPVANGFNSTLTLDNYDYSMNGQYYCQVSSNIPNPNNCVISVQSRTVRVSGFRPPTVKTQPQKSIDACVGTSTSATAEFNGTGLSFEWYQDGKLLPNSNTNVLALANITPAAAGKYVVVATGTCGLKTASDTVTVTVLDKPAVTKQPLDTVLTVGNRLDLSIEAKDIRTVQWYKNDVAITGATTATFSKASVVKTDAGYYSARVTNACGVVISKNAKVEVNDPVIPRPAIELGQTSVDFGEIPVGYDKTVSLTGLIKNVGTAPLNITSLKVSPSEFSLSNAPATPFDVAPGSAQSITVKAAPTVKGPLFGTMTISSNSPLKPQATVSLSAAYVLRYDHPASQDFGLLELGKSNEKCVTVTNTSSQEVTIDQATVIGLNAAEFTVTTTMPVKIATGASAEICVKFAPGTAGKKAAQLSLRSSNGGNATIDLTGAGEAVGNVVDAVEAGVSVSPNPVRDELNIHFGKSMPRMDIDIVNSAGRTVASISNDAVEAGSIVRYSGTTLASGSYTLFIKYGNTVTTVPVIVVR
ncbi:MAG: choice-of-anchor D domain-containing protein [Candidatus Kapabacteria bacterium]|nr:choice-of-anchor D domain-containing protein [Candidatus Kapabacteria bacterium]